MTTYNIDLTPNCKEEPLELRLAATGSIFIYVNDRMLVEWGEPYPRSHFLNISAEDQECGCNSIRVMVLNYYFESPAALIYSLQQSDEGCQCQESMFGHYNDDTCEC